MTWFTWRQARTQTWITVGLLAAVGIALALTSRDITDAYNTANVAACQGDCSAAFDSFLRAVRNGIGGAVYDLATMLVYALPTVIGVFWGAPLVARELETGTHRLAWTQSVTRTRWLATKLAVIGGATVAAVGLLSWAVTIWADRIDDASGTLISPGVFGARGLVPIGYALFAFTVGVTLGMLVRRTVPAMAATLALTVAAVVSMEGLIREHLVSVSHATIPLDVYSVESLIINDTDQAMYIVGQADLPGAWVLSNETITHTGEVFSGPADPRYCGPQALSQNCQEWVDSLGLRQAIAYHPVDHFWPLQWAETGIFIALAVLLTGFCFWWLRRHVT